MLKLRGSTVRLISGTQVITSVHSVVKELVENSLDSGSTNVEVNLENFGLDKLEVRDNGNGILKEEVPYVAKCHYTSKLKDISDLDTLETFGFRGEALSSLATVASLSVITATKEDNVGMVYNFDSAGNITSSRPVAAIVGTCVTATDLFVNVPVRRQFYKNSNKCRDELRKIEHLMIAFGLVHNSVRFVLRHSRNVIWQKAVMSNLHSNMVAIFGSSVVQQMKWLHNSQNEVTELSGYFPALGANTAEVTRSSADHMYVFVNKRLVDIKQVNQVVRDAFKSAYPAKRYPVMCLFIRVPQGEVDVNVEPNKCSILLHNLDEILDQLTNLLGQLCRPETDDDCLMKQQRQQQLEDTTTSVDENFSQFSDNAVLSPPTANNVQLVLPADDCTGSSVTDLLFTSNRAGLTNDAGCTVLPSSPQSMPPPHEGLDNDVNILESPDIDNPIFQAQPLLKEADERTADTVIIPSEDTNAENNKESPFKITTSGCTQSWSKGHYKEGHRMEPVSLLQKDHSSRPSHDASLTKKPNTSFKFSREVCRSNKKSSQKMKLTNFFDKVGIAKATTRVPQVVIKFHKDNVRTYWEEDKNFSIHYSNRPSVIGPINHRCQWLVVVDQHIRLFDVKRANQNVLYNRLLGSFKLPASPLPTAVSIGEHNVGGLDSVSLLKTLDSESTAANGNRFYNDPRLVANGFHLCQRIVHGRAEIELVSLHKSLKLTDLQETLTLIKEQASQKELHNVLLQDCRPLAVQKLLQEEAVRMSQVQLSTLQAADVLELMDQEQVDSQCYHLVHTL